MIEVGDQIEVRGPIGGYFVWEAKPGNPSLLVAGGSGIVPLMAMIRHRAAIGSLVPTTLLYSSRVRDGIIYFEELERLKAKRDGFDVVHTLTRDNPPGWTGPTRRIDRAMLRQVAEPLGKSLQSFVCGPTALVESVAEELVASGLAPSRIRTERFGPTGTEPRTGES